MVAAMDKVGVDGAIYISSFSMYQYDGSYAVSVEMLMGGACAKAYGWSPKKVSTA
jgi:hypothetical protein